jgi:hypothetical protein
MREYVTSVWNTRSPGGARIALSGNEPIYKRHLEREPSSKAPSPARPFRAQKEEKAPPIQNRPGRSAKTLSPTYSNPPRINPPQSPPPAGDFDLQISSPFPPQVGSAISPKWFWPGSGGRTRFAGLGAKIARSSRSIRWFRVPESAAIWLCADCPGSPPRPSRNRRRLAIDSSLFLPNLNCLIISRKINCLINVLLWFCSAALWEPVQNATGQPEAFHGRLGGGVRSRSETAKIPTILPFGRAAAWTVSWIWDWTPTPTTTSPASSSSCCISPRSPC